jgi:hypothetical protein
MRDIIFGIYGFDFHEPRLVRHVDLVPLFPRVEATKRGADKDEFHLTGYGRFDACIDNADASARYDLVGRLADAMTFLQQQHVIVTHLIEMSPGDSVEALVVSGRLPDTLQAFQKRPGGGSLLMGDGCSTKSRTDLLERFANLALNPSPPIPPLLGAIYRQVEIWRLSKPLLEVKQFLAFSGLEILGRAFGPSPQNRNAAVQISGYLRKLGFDVPQLLAEEWTAARNGVFHQGQITTINPATGKSVDAGDQMFALTTILADACLKELRFSDPHINWDRWRSYQAFC